MEEKKCIKCGMPLETEEDCCSCKDGVCCHCCECAPECDCGCQKKGE